MDIKKMEECPVCGCSLKPENYERHIRRVHKKKMIEENDDGEKYNTSSSREKGESKRAKHRQMKLQHRKRKAKSIMIVSMMLIMVLSMVIFVAMSMNGNESIQNPEPVQVNENESNQNLEPEQESPVQSKSEVRIPLSQISNSAVFYAYDVDGIQVRFFTAKDSGGEVHVAFDACDICYYEKKGYRQSGDVMQCINCGNQYPIVSLGTKNVAGGCWPSYLPMNIGGDDITIKISDIEEKAYMF